MRLCYFLVFVLLACVEPQRTFSTPKATKPAKLEVKGYGLLGNWRLKRMLRDVELGGKKPEFFAPTFIEDSALLLTSRVKEDGYRTPVIRISIELAGGEKLRVDSNELMESPLSPELRATAIIFSIEKGVLYHYRRLTVEGLTVLKEKEALSYFIEAEGLLNTKGMRVYTPQRLRQGLSSLTDALERRGYVQAQVTAAQEAMDPKSGAVDVRIQVREGPKFLVRSVREETPQTNSSVSQVFSGPKPYSRFWVQDFAVQLKNVLYRKGYPDVTVDLKPDQGQTNANLVMLDMVATVNPGNQVRVGQVVFQGQKRTNPVFMSRRVRVERGDLLNPIRVEAGRFRLAELGIFQHVDVAYTNVDENTRSVFYSVEEGKRREISLLFGWGSYELLRGGVIYDEYNIWGLAHHVRLKATQSIKATSGDLTYTIPDILGKNADLFLYGSGLRREEISFTRVEYGGGVGVHKLFTPVHTDVNLRYSYQILDAMSIVPAVASEGLTNPAVGSIILDLKHDRRDSPLYPRRGYKIFLNIETAASELGGDANYERVELWTSWHHRLMDSMWLSLGFSHGVAISFGSASDNLPFNKRFFPGGANSIRGYQEGEASPRNEEQQIVGAESYMLGTVELEQALNRKWSIVGFVDTLGIAEHMENYPFNRTLYSVGGGLRWRTLIGPVRLEYGYNLNPRHLDPTGTLQFSFGFPF